MPLSTILGVCLARSFLEIVFHELSWAKSVGTLSKPSITLDSELENDRPTMTMANQVELSIYVEGLPYSTNVEEVIQYFENKNIKVKEVRLPTFHDSGRARGYCHIDLQSKDDLDGALKLDGSGFGSRYLKISTARPKVKPRKLAARASRPPNCRTLFVKNLSYETSEEAIKEVFSRYGRVISVRLARWNHTGKLKGFGYIEYQSEVGVENVEKESNSIWVGEREVEIDYEANGKGPRRSFRDASGRNWHKVEGKSVKKQRLR